MYVWSRYRLDQSGKLTDTAVLAKSASKVTVNEVLRLVGAKGSTARMHPPAGRESPGDL
jgi:hypothetical protein